MDRRPSRIGPKSATRRGVDWLPVNNEKEIPIVVTCDAYSPGPWFSGNSQSITPPASSWYGGEGAEVIQTKVQKRSAPATMRIESMRMEILEE
jgi:hypothetical protein